MPRPGPLSRAALLAASAFAASAFAASEVEFRVDARVEIASVLCRLAGFEEFQDPRLPAYDEAVNLHFAPYRNHPSVRLLAQLHKQRGIAYNAALELALLAEDDVSWSPRLPLRPLPAFLDNRWDPRSAARFLQAARRFALDSGAPAFFRGQAAAHSAIASIYATHLAPAIDLAWYRAHFSVPGGTVFRVLPAPLAGPNSYGTALQFPAGRLELAALLALPKVRPGEALDLPESSSLQLVVHEFCHPFVNPWVDAHSSVLRAPAETLFREVGKVASANAYTRWNVLLYESLVRAATLRYLQDHNQHAAARISLKDDRLKGFWWTDELATLLSPQPGGLDSHLPAITALFGRWAANTATLIAAKQAEVERAEQARLRQGPQIASLSPAEGATASAAATTLLEIRFDRPMARSVSLFGDVPTVTGKPSWDDSATLLRIPVSLQPGRKYVLYLNKEGEEGGFRSQAGERLQPRTWSFTAAP